MRGLLSALGQKLALWFGPTLRSIKGHLNKTEILQVLATTITVMATAQSVLVYFLWWPPLAVLNGELLIAIGAITALYDGIRRMNQGADIVVTSLSPSAPVVVTPAPTQATVITQPPDQPFSAAPPLVVPQTPNQPTVIVPPAHPEEAPHG